MRTEIAEQIAPELTLPRPAVNDQILGPDINHER